MQNYQFNKSESICWKCVGVWQFVFNSQNTRIRTCQPYEILSRCFSPVCWQKLNWGVFLRTQSFNISVQKAMKRNRMEIFKYGSWWLCFYFWLSTPKPKWPQEYHHFVVKWESLNTAGFESLALGKKFVLALLNLISLRLDVSSFYLN